MIFPWPFPALHSEKRWLALYQIESLFLLRWSAEHFFADLHVFAGLRIGAIGIFGGFHEDFGRPLQPVFVRFGI